MMSQSKSYVAVDIHLPYLVDCKRLSDGQPVHFIRADVEHLPLKPKCADCVMLLDVIEHINKRDAFVVIENAERLARKAVIIFTPNGNLPQEAYDDNPRQAHLSDWTAKEFEKLGYGVEGVNGLKPFRGHLAAIRWKPLAFWDRLSVLSQIFAWKAPRAAFQLLATKIVEDNMNKQDHLPRDHRKGFQL